MDTPQVTDIRLQFTPQRRLTENLPPNLEASVAAFEGTFLSML